MPKVIYHGYVITVHNGRVYEVVCKHNHDTVEDSMKCANDYMLRNNIDGTCTITKSDNSNFTDDENARVKVWIEKSIRPGQRIEYLSREGTLEELDKIKKGNPNAN